MNEVIVIGLDILVLILAGFGVCLAYLGFKVLRWIEPEIKRIEKETGKKCW